jgi:hypothetical protein
MESENTGKAKGGYARAAKLTPEERKAIAQKAAKERWDVPVPCLPKAMCPGVLKIGDIKIPCAVLDNGKRVLTEHGITNAILGSRSGASKRIKKAQENEGALMPLFVAPRNIKALISKELWDGPLASIQYHDGNKVVNAYDANLLPTICDIWLKAREGGLLQKQQYAKAQRAEMLMRGLAGVGIVALVDEATGYQTIRPQDALQKYLEMLIRKELAAWAKKFPDEFYENIYKLKGWPWPGMKKNRFSVVAHYTRDLVYDRIAPTLLEELEKRSPKDETGNRKNKLHQWLTEDVGDPMLAQHLHSLIMFQRLAIANGYGWHRFIKMVDKVLPRKGANLELPLNLDDLDSIGL